MPRTEQFRASFHVPASADGRDSLDRVRVFALLDDEVRRRATGSFYTPPRITRQVVRDAIGPLVESAGREANADERVWAAPYLNLQILDPAMGCGNFLIGAAEFLVQAMLADPCQPTGDIQHGHATRLRRLVVEHCLYGVDINPAAVRHAREALIEWCAGDRSTRASLRRHLRRGNSLLTADLSEVLAMSDGARPPTRTKLRAAADCWVARYFDRTLGRRHLQQIVSAWHNPCRWRRLVGEEWFRRLRRLARRQKRFFHWELEFHDVFSSPAHGPNPRSGFDAVIGNPPYLESVAMRAASPEERRFLNARFSTAAGNWDLFVPFVQLSVECTRQGGYTGLVLPNKLLSADYCSRVRRLLSGRRLVSIDDYSHAEAFQGIDVYPVSVVAQNRPRGSDDKVACRRADGAAGNDRQPPIRVVTPAHALDGLLNSTWQPLLSGAADLLTRVFRDTRPLAELAMLGDAATVAESYLIGPLVGDGRAADADDSSLRLVNTGAIDRYGDNWLTRPVRYLGKTYVRPSVSAAELGEAFPKRLIQSTSPKIVLAGLSRHLEAIYDDRGDVLAGKSTVIVHSANLDLRYLLAVLNSRLLTWVYRQLFGGMSLDGGYMQVNPRQVGRLPIRVISYTTPAEERNRMIAKVRSIISHSPGGGRPIAMYAFVRGLFAKSPPRPDVLYDVVVELADEMRRLHGDLQQRTIAYHRRLESVLGAGIETLLGRATLRTLHHRQWPDVHRVLLLNRRRLRANFDCTALTHRLRTDFDETIDHLRRLDARHVAIDEAIDECVFQLYGVSATQGDLVSW